MEKIGLPIKIALYKLASHSAYLKSLPLNYGVAVTYRCNCRCLTCRIHENLSAGEEELSLEEYEKIFGHLGHSPYWATFTGGEPFLREDFADIIKTFYLTCKPKIINIATNGTLVDAVTAGIHKILSFLSRAVLIVNLSIDGIGEKHDNIRGHPGCYEKAINTYNQLKKIKRKNFILGINTVISKYNVEDFPEIYRQVQRLQPGSYITEIAQQRDELMTAALKLAPSYDRYNEAMGYMRKNALPLAHNSFGRIIWEARLRYYDTVSRSLSDGKDGSRCFAGIASAHISPYGKVSFCCMRPSAVGYLRDVKYDFGKLWFSGDAAEKREMIKTSNCACTLANTFYTNLLCNFRGLLSIAGNIYFGKR